MKKSNILEISAEKVQCELSCCAIPSTPEQPASTGTAATSTVKYVLSRTIPTYAPETVCVTGV